MVLLVVGCYSGDELVERVRNKAIRTRLEEIELGQFRVTLPRNEQTGEMIEVDIRVFGQSQRYKLNEIEDQLEVARPILEDRLLTALRGFSRRDLAEPDLNTLRAELLTVSNELLEDEPLEAIGFYDVRFIRH